MGKVNITINFDRPVPVYYPGEIVSGDVALEVEEEIKTREVRIEISGKAKVHWTEGFGRNQRHYKSSEQYFEYRISLRRDDADSFMLQPGHHQYRFQQVLPLQLPNSFEACHGRIRYLAKLVIDRPWHFDDEFGRPFTVISHLDLNYIPNIMTPLAVQESKFLCCCCCRTGPISATLMIPRGGFVPGEKIPINGECINNSGRLMEATKATLFMKSVLHAGSDTHTSTYPLVTIERPAIRPRASDFWQGEGLLVPPCAPSGLPGCSIIDIDYYVQLDMVPSGLSSNLDVSTPVVIGTIPPAQVLRDKVYGYESAFASETAYLPAYPSLPYPTYQSFDIPDMGIPVIKEKNGGVFAPLYPRFDWDVPL